MTSSAYVSLCLQIWWLDPELTYGNAKPFVFTQGHSVCNRSFFPCFDTPAVKCTYSAVVKVRILVGAVSASFRHCKRLELTAGLHTGSGPPPLDSFHLPRLGSRLLKAVVLVRRSCREVKDRPYGGQVEGPGCGTEEGRSLMEVLELWPKHGSLNRSRLVFQCIVLTRGHGSLTQPVRLSDKNLRASSWI